MIVQEEYICKNGVKLIHTYSDKHNYIRQLETGIKYNEAYDIPDKYTYEETDELIEDEIEEEEANE